MRIVRAARDVNYRQRERVIEKLTRELRSLEGKVVGLLGLAFKPHTDDLRDGPSLDIARRLLERGARVRAHDPVALPRARVECRNTRIQLCESLDQLAKGAHALVLVTEWPEYGALRWKGLGSTMRNRLILDARNFLDRKELESAGFRYVGIGGRDRLFTEKADASTQAIVCDSISARETVLSRRAVTEMFSQSLPVSG
jgi:UDPglucose 6-dehydrogenase